jgi:kynurenine formamidase
MTQGNGHHAPSGELVPMEVWRSTASRLRNWGRWGPADQLGTLNLIDEEMVASAARLVRRGKVFPLGVDFNADGPQGANSVRRNPVHLMTVHGGNVDIGAVLADWEGTAYHARFGQEWRDNIFRYNDDFIMMPLQAATQWDALAHAYYDDQLYNGYPAETVTHFGATRASIDKVDRKGIVGRGVLLDVPRHRGLARLPALAGIEPEELTAVAEAQGVAVGTGDIVLIRTGWWGEWQEFRRPTWGGSAPGVTWRVAEWLHERGCAAIAADNNAVEVMQPTVERVRMPFHLLCLRDMGLMLGEMWSLDELAADCATDGIYEFQLVAPPLRVTGAVGSPVNPIALK